MCEQMSFLQNITSTLEEHGKRLKYVEDESKLLTAQIETLAQRVDQIKKNSHNKQTATIQINRILYKSNEDLNNIVNDIGG